MGQRVFLVVFLLFFMLISITKMVFEGFSTKILIALILAIIIVALLWLRPFLNKK